MVKADSLWLKGQEILKNNNIDNPRLCAGLLLCATLGCDRTHLLTRDLFADESQSELFLSFIKRASKHEPIQYITGHTEFMSLDFKVTKDTLIPRADTETLAEYAIKIIGNKQKTILDIGTGSGCLAISICKYCKNATAYAVDISEGTLLTARENAERHGVSNRIEFFVHDILTCFPTNVKSADVIVSNPPYITPHEYLTLDDNVRLYEPKIALTDDDDGLLFYRKIIGGLPNGWKGTIAFEVGYNQARDVLGFLKKDEKLRNFEILKDLSGIERVVTAHT